MGELPEFMRTGKLVGSMSPLSYESHQLIMDSAHSTIHKGMKPDEKLVNSLVLAYLEKCGEANVCKDLRKRMQTKRTPKAFATLESIVTAYVKAKEIEKTQATKRKQPDDANDSVSAPPATKKAKKSNGAAAKSDSSDDEGMETDEVPKASNNGTKEEKKESSSDEDDSEEEDDPSPPPAKKMMKPVVAQPKQAESSS